MAHSSSSPSAPVAPMRGAFADLRWRLWMYSACVIISLNTFMRSAGLRAEILGSIQLLEGLLESPLHQGVSITRLSLLVLLAPILFLLTCLVVEFLAKQYPGREFTKRIHCLCCCTGDDIVGGDESLEQPLQQGGVEQQRQQHEHEEGATWRLTRCCHGCCRKCQEGCLQRVFGTHVDLGIAPSRLVRHGGWSFFVFFGTVAIAMCVEMVIIVRGPLTFSGVYSSKASWATIGGLTAIYSVRTVATLFVCVAGVICCFFPIRLQALPILVLTSVRATQLFTVFAALCLPMCLVTVSIRWWKKMLLLGFIVYHYLFPWWYTRTPERGFGVVVDAAESLIAEVYGEYAAQHVGKTLGAISAHSKFPVVFVDEKRGNSAVHEELGTGYVDVNINQSQMNLEDHSLGPWARSGVQPGDDGKSGRSSFVLLQDEGSLNGSQRIAVDGALAVSADGSSAESAGTPFASRDIPVLDGDDDTYNDEYILEKDDDNMSFPRVETMEVKNRRLSEHLFSVPLWTEKLADPDVQDPLLFGQVAKEFLVTLLLLLCWFFSESVLAVIGGIVIAFAIVFPIRMAFPVATITGIGYTCAFLRSCLFCAVVLHNFLVLPSGTPLALFYFTFSWHGLTLYSLLITMWMLGSFGSFQFDAQELYEWSYERLVALYPNVRILVPMVGILGALLFIAGFILGPDVTSSLNQWIQSSGMIFSGQPGSQIPKLVREQASLMDEITQYLAIVWIIVQLVCTIGFLYRIGFFDLFSLCRCDVACARIRIWCCGSPDFQDDVAGDEVPTRSQYERLSWFARFRWWFHGHVWGAIKRNKDVVAIFFPLGLGILAVSVALFNNWNRIENFPSYASTSCCTSNFSLMCKSKDVCYMWLMQGMLQGWFRPLFFMVVHATFALQCTLSAYMASSRRHVRMGLRELLCCAVTTLSFLLMILYSFTFYNYDPDSQGDVIALCVVMGLFIVVWMVFITNMIVYRSGKANFYLLLWNCVLFLASVFIQDALALFNELEAGILLLLALGSFLVGLSMIAFLQP